MHQLESKNPSFFFFYLFIYLFFISWRLITLQYCSGFCHTLKWISHGFTCGPCPDPTSHLPLHPIPQVRALVSCIQPGLVICFTLDNTHVSMLFSWNIWTFYSILGYSQLTNNAVMVSGEQQRDSAIHIHVSILRQMTLPSRLPHNFEQSSMKNASFLPQPVICGESHVLL